MVGLGVMLTTLTTVPATALSVAPRLMVVAGTSTVTGVAPRWWHQHRQVPVLIAVT